MSDAMKALEEIEARLKAATPGPCIEEPRRSRVWRELNREKSREVQKRWRDKNRAKTREKERRAVSTPEGRRKQLARWRFKFAVRRGWITRPAGMVFHHPDYARDYFGCWVTPLEHQRIHAELIECPPCHDYADRVRELQAAAKAARNSNAGRSTCEKRWGRRELSGVAR